MMRMDGQIDWETEYAVCMIAYASKVAGANDKLEVHSQINTSILYHI
jgi:hypothetical protein